MNTVMRIRAKTFLCAALVGLWVLNLSGAGLAATKPKKVNPEVAAPASVLFIGNSFFYYSRPLKSI